MRLRRPVQRLDQLSMTRAAMLSYYQRCSLDVSN